MMFNKTFTDYLEDKKYKNRNPKKTTNDNRDVGLDKAWDYFVITGDFSLVSDIRRERENAARYREIWD